MSAALAGKIQDRVDGQRQHRTSHEIAALAPEHRFGFRMFAEQAAIDQRRQILAALGGEFETVMDRIGWGHGARRMASSEWRIGKRISSFHSLFAFSKKKSRARSPALKIVSTLFPRKFGFDLDGRGDAACARQGSSRDLDHQT